MKRARSVQKLGRLMEAVVENNAELVRAVLKNGALVDQADEQGTAALTMACKLGHPDCVRALLEACAPVTQAKQDGMTALMLACQNGHMDCVRALLKAGAPVAQARQDGMTALMLAFLNGHLECVHALLEAGAPMEQARQDGITALMWACQNGHMDCVRALLEAGAPVAQAMQDGMTALMLACMNGHLECVRALLEAGAQLAQTQQDGATALVLACMHGRLNCVRALLEAGASVSKIDNGGFSLLALACPHLPLLQLLCVHGVRRHELTEDELARMPEECRAWIRATWRWTSELHHLELLPPARVRELLVGGADLHACDGGADAPTPLLLARALLQRDSGHEGAQLVVHAAAPWSPVVNHSLFPARARTRAMQLFVLGHLLARERPELVIAGRAFIDVWAEHVMPHALTRDGL
jgi:ankyrin repeat protein